MTQFVQKAIPKLMTTYPQTLHINESNEEFVQFTKDTHPNIFLRPMYFEDGLRGSLPHIYLRKEAFERVLQAAENLPHGYGLLLYDGYRPISVQQHLFENVQASIKLKNPQLSEQQLHEQTLIYVAFPSLDKQATAPHITGGAIDLTLTDRFGTPLHMGTEFDEVSPKSATAYFEDDHSDEVAKFNRRILYYAMIEAGFANYEEEWWHYEFGNKSWAARVGATETKYAPIDMNLK